MDTAPRTQTPMCGALHTSGCLYLASYTSDLTYSKTWVLFHDVQRSTGWMHLAYVPTSVRSSHRLPPKSNGRGTVGPYLRRIQTISSHSRMITTTTTRRTFTILKVFRDSLQAVKWPFTMTPSHKPTSSAAFSETRQDVAKCLQST